MSLVLSLFTFADHCTLAEMGNLFHFTHFYWYFPYFIINKDLNNQHLIPKDDPFPHILHGQFIEILIEACSIDKDDLQFLWEIFLTILGR